MENREQPKIFTKLKFQKSETGAYISFVSQNTKTGRYSGVSQDSQYPKKIVIVDKKLASQVIPKVLYDATLIPMKERDGYIAVELKPVSFSATIETTYVPKALYKIEIKFGNKTILYDPVDGRKDCVRTIGGVKKILEKRMDLMNLPQVVEDFLAAASILVRRLENDGIIVEKTRTTNGKNARFR